MMKSTAFVACLSALLGAATVASLQACAQPSSNATPDHSQHGGSPTAPGQTLSPSEQLHAIMMRPMDSMSMSGDVDKDFATLMIPHHQGAIDMAEIELNHGKNEELKDLARNIIDSQKAEIEILKKNINP